MFHFKTILFFCKFSYNYSILQIGEMAYLSQNAYLCDKLQILNGKLHEKQI